MKEEKTIRNYILIITVVIIASMISIVFKHRDISSGLIIGGTYHIFANWMIEIFTNNKSSKKSLIVYVLLNGVKIVLLGALLFLAGYLTYYKNTQLINIFALFAGYMIVQITFIIQAWKGKKTCKRN